MAKRYYVSDLIGDGTDENPFRPLIDSFGVPWVASIQTDANGFPVFADALVLVNTPNHAVLRNQPGITPLPDFPLDGKISAIQTGTKNAMLAALADRKFDTTSIGNADGYRDAIQAIGRQRDPVFDVDRFDIR